MICEQLRTSGDRTFTYILGDEKTRKAAVVDPGYDPEKILAWLQEKKLEAVYVINTHGHYDHTGGNDRILSSTRAKLIAWGCGDVPINDGSVVKLGETDITIIHTPGHTSDGICILAGNVLLSGDTLFVGKVGGTDFGKGAREEYESLHEKIMRLPDTVKVYPGHDYGVRPSSTIGEERKENPFLLCPDFKAFVDLKKNWTQYKREHGIA